MNRRILGMLALAACISASAQQSAGQFGERYRKLAGTVGAAGVGVEYLLDRWEEAWPEDPAVHEGRFNYWYAKSRTEEIQKVDAAKYLGQKPVLSLKDSLGAPVNYFMVPQFSDSLFRKGQESIERAIALNPSELRYRFDKIASLADYEKDSPDMAATALLGLIDLDASQHPAWVLDGEALGKDGFEAAVQEYCYLFYRIGSASSYESFRIISEKMLKLNPRNTLFLNNMGAYWQVARRNDKQASKYYKKVLKISPDDAAAKSNLEIIDRNAAKKKKK